MVAFYWLLGMISYHPAGCDGLLAMCTRVYVCLSLCVALCSRDNGTTAFKF